MNSVNTTGQYIVFGLTNWVDLKCPNDYICIDYCYIGDDMSRSYLKKYSMPYNNPKLKFAILCDSEKDAEWLNDIICEELEEYEKMIAKITPIQKIETDEGGIGSKFCTNDTCEI